MLDAAVRALRGDRAQHRLRQHLVEPPRRERALARRSLRGSSRPAIVPNWRSIRWSSSSGAALNAREAHLLPHAQPRARRRSPSRRPMISTSGSTRTRVRSPRGRRPCRPPCRPLRAAHVTAHALEQRVAQQRDPREAQLQAAVAQVVVAGVVAAPDVLGAEALRRTPPSRRRAGRGCPGRPCARGARTAPGSRRPRRARARASSLRAQRLDLRVDRSRDLDSDAGAVRRPSPARSACCGSSRSRCGSRERAHRRRSPPVGDREHLLAERARAGQTEPQ